MRCDGSADPTVAGEINTYINLEREDNSHNSIEEVLPKCKHTKEVSAQTLITTLLCIEPIFISYKEMQLEMF